MKTSPLAASSIGALHRHLSSTGAIHRRHPATVSGPISFKQGVKRGCWRVMFWGSIDVLLPGLKSGDIKVQVEDDNVLVISGERKREQEQEEKEGVKYVRMERRIGKFMSKVFRLLL